MTLQTGANIVLLVLCAIYLLALPWFLAWIIPLARAAKGRLRGILTGIAGLYSVIGLDSLFWAYVLALSVINHTERAAVTPVYLGLLAGFVTVRVGALGFGAYLWRLLSAKWG